MVRLRFWRTDGLCGLMIGTDEEIVNWLEREWEEMGYEIYFWGFLQGRANGTVMNGEVRYVID